MNQVACSQASRATLNRDFNLFYVLHNNKRYASSVVVHSVRAVHGPSSSYDNDCVLAKGLVRVRTSQNHQHLFEQTSCQFSVIMYVWM